MRFCLLLLALALPQAVNAGVFEVGASANYRSSKYNDDNYVQSLTYTGSFSYYFWEMCAWEINYTTGTSKQVTKGSGDSDPRTTIEDNIDLVSLDLVLSFAGRQDPFRPYIKIGGGYLIKERFRQIDDDDKEKISEQKGTVPAVELALASASPKSSVSKSASTHGPLRSVKIRWSSTTRGGRASLGCFEIYRMAITCLILSGCQLSYYMHSAYHQTRLITSRQSVKKALASDQLNEEQKVKLRLVEEAKAFAESDLGSPNPATTPVLFSSMNLMSPTSSRRPMPMNSNLIYGAFHS